MSHSSYCFFYKLMTKNTEIVLSMNNPWHFPVLKNHSAKSNRAKNKKG